MQQAVYFTGGLHHSSHWPRKIPLLARFCTCACSGVQSRLTLCNPMDYTYRGSSVHWIFQEKILGWVSTSSSRDLPDTGFEPTSSVSPALAGKFFTTEPPRKPKENRGSERVSNWPNIIQMVNSEPDFELDSESSTLWTSPPWGTKTHKANVLVA